MPIDLNSGTEIEFDLEKTPIHSNTY